MKHLAWAVTWIVVGMVTTLATANVLLHSAQLHRTAAVEPSTPAPEPLAAPIAKARPPAEFGRSVTPATFRQRDRD